MRDWAYIVFLYIFNKLHIYLKIYQIEYTRVNKICILLSPPHLMNEELLNFDLSFLLYTEM